MATMEAFQWDEISADVAQVTFEAPASATPEQRLEAANDAILNSLEDDEGFVSGMFVARDKVFRRARKIPGVWVMDAVFGQNMVMRIYLSTTGNDAAAKRVANEELEEFLDSQ